MSKPGVVVFGGSGYIGNAVSEYMKNDFRVTVADIRPPASQLGLGFSRCDVRDAEDVSAALDGASVALYFSVIQIPQINTEGKLGYEVNVRGFQNVCEATLTSPTMKGLVQSGTWHVFGERGLEGTVDETHGFNPDGVEDRAKTYALSKVVQESVARLYDALGAPLGKTFSVIRMGTVLGENMPEATAASLFIKNASEGKPLTPYSNSMYRPMLYVDIVDICKAYYAMVQRIIAGDTATPEGRLNVVNVFWPNPINIEDLAEYVRDAFKDMTKGKIVPRIQVKETGLPSPFAREDKLRFKIDTKRASSFLGLDHLTSPRDSIYRLVGRKVLAR